MRPIASVLNIPRGPSALREADLPAGAASHPRVISPEAPADCATMADDAAMILPSGARTILVVDDEVVVRDIAVKMLHRHGFQALEAADGAEALRLFETRRPEIAAVLLDLVMPVMGGDEALRAMRRIDRAVPVIVSSGYSAKTVRARCGLERPDGFLQKPYHDRELLEVLRQAF